MRLKSAINTPGKRLNPMPRFIASVSVTLLLLATAILTSPVNSDSRATEWEEKIARITWVGYSPSTADPVRKIEAAPEAVRADLAVLRKAGFTGLITYSSSGAIGRQLPALAQSAGFEGLIAGVWDPTSTREIATARAIASSPVVLGFCVGNEGLRRRYKLSALSSAIETIRKTTGKPVTTTEIIEEYLDENLLRLGDWIFPNVHPYFHNQLDPLAAVEWTKGAYDDLKRRSDRFVLLKEVGLPTAGDPQGRLSEWAQERYYIELAKTDVRFAYFEAFDQRWKKHLPVEPHWGIFRADRTPKKLGRRMMESEPPLQTAGDSAPFYIYRDIDSPDNHYKPTGYMGDIGDITVDEAFEGKPHSGKTCIRIVYEAKGKAPNECSYAPPCKWAGVYWQEPPNNWGRDEINKGKGIDLSRYNRLVFWARADRECVIEFKVGGIAGSFGDSLVYPRSRRASLSKNWQEFEIDLTGANLKHLIGGFCWATNWDLNPKGATFYLDDIRFEKR